MSDKTPTARWRHEGRHILMPMRGVKGQWVSALAHKVEDAANLVGEHNQAIEAAMKAERERVQAEERLFGFKRGWDEAMAFVLERLTSDEVLDHVRGWSLDDAERWAEARIRALLVVSEPAPTETPAPEKGPRT